MTIDVHSCVTRFWKTDQIVTTDLFHFIGPASSCTHTPPIHSAIIRLGWLVCFYRASFANHVNSRMIQYDPWKALHGRHGSDIGLSGSETFLRPSKHVWVYGWHFLDSWLVQTVQTRVNLPPAACSPQPLTPSPSLPPIPLYLPLVILQWLW